LNEGANQFIKHGTGVKNVKTKSSEVNQLMAVMVSIIGNRWVLYIGSYMESSTGAGCGVEESVCVVFTKKLLNNSVVGGRGKWLRVQSAGESGILGRKGRHVGHENDRLFYVAAP